MAVSKTSVSAPRHPWYCGAARYRGPRTSLDTSGWRALQREAEQERRQQERGRRGSRSFRTVAGQIRSGQNIPNPGLPIVYWMPYQDGWTADVWNHGPAERAASGEV